MDDLIEFARTEKQAGDIEPWAATIGQLYRLGALDLEDALWVLKLYNTYDDLGSAWRCYRTWPSPRAWMSAHDRSAAATFPISRERRNLYGGRVIRHLDSYAGCLDGRTQASWLADGGTGLDGLTRHLRAVWGVGRLAAFEWAEFLAKIIGVRVRLTGAQLWESSGPRQSLERLYGPMAGPRDLDVAASDCRASLSAAGVSLSWWDFETVVCDFKVMCNGRYYPGKHIAMIRDEIEGLAVETDRDLLRRALAATVPEAWMRAIKPGVDKAMNKVYRDSGRVPGLTEVAA